MPSIEDQYGLILLRRYGVKLDTDESKWLVGYIGDLRKLALTYYRFHSDWLDINFQSFMECLVRGIVERHPGALDRIGIDARPLRDRCLYENDNLLRAIHYHDGIVSQMNKMIGQFAKRDIKLK